MARKGQRRGLKRSKAPRHWRLPRKQEKWTINPHPGPHNKEAIPLAFIVRDFLKYARTLREAKRILNERKVKINGTVRTDYRFPVGILDVVDIPQADKCYRVLPNKKGTLILHPISGEETHLRPLKVSRKQLVKEGAIQLGFHDGTTMVVEETKSEEGPYLPRGTILYDFTSGKIVEYFPFAEGNYALITGGRNVSATGRVASIEGEMVEIEGDQPYRTLRENVFILGTTESAISLGG